jgi:hypothetical protein
MIRRSRTAHQQVAIYRPPFISTSRNLIAMNLIPNLLGGPIFEGQAATEIFILALVQPIYKTACDHDDPLNDRHGVVVLSGGEKARSR